MTPIATATTIKEYTHRIVVLPLSAVEIIPTLHDGRRNPSECTSAQYFSRAILTSASPNRPNPVTKNCPEETCKTWPRSNTVRDLGIASLTLCVTGNPTRLLYPPALAARSYRLRMEKGLAKIILCRKQWISNHPHDFRDLCDYDRASPKSAPRNLARTFLVPGSREGWAMSIGRYLPIERESSSSSAAQLVLTKMMVRPMAKRQAVKQVQTSPVLQIRLGPDGLLWRGRRPEGQKMSCLMLAWVLRARGKLLSRSK